MAKALIGVTLSQQVLFKRSNSILSSSSSFRSRSLPSLFFSPVKNHNHNPLVASLSSHTAMGQTPAATTAADAGMDAVQRRLMFDDESVPFFFNLHLIYLFNSHFVDRVSVYNFKIDARFA